MKLKDAVLLISGIIVLSNFGCKKDEGESRQSLILDNIEQQKPLVKKNGLRDIDRNRYSTVEIGTQQWTASNLNVSRYRNGDLIPQVSDPTAWSNLTTGAWCYYNNDPATEAVYGKLYNWHAVNDPRGLAPTGWHIPSDAEWTVLLDYLGGASVAGDKMKSTGTYQAGTGFWNEPNGGATNSSGFTCLPAGYRNVDGSFGPSKTEVAFFWSSTFSGVSSSVIFISGGPNVFLCKFCFPGIEGFSVRCVRD